MCGPRPRIPPLRQREQEVAPVSRTPPRVPAPQAHDGNSPRPFPAGGCFPFPDDDYFDNTIFWVTTRTLPSATLLTRRRAKYMPEGSCEASQSRLWLPAS